MKILILSGAMALAACNLEESLDNSPPGKTIVVKKCAMTAAQAADTANYAYCEPKRPESLK